MNRESIPIVLASDDRFRIGLLTTIRSIGQHLAPGCRLEVNVLDCGLSDPGEVHAVLQRNALGDTRVTIRPVPLEKLEALSINRAKLSKAAFARLLAPSLLPDLDRVLYLDSDLLVTGDLRQLWNVDLRGAPLGAVPDPYFVFLGEDVSNCRALGLSPFHRYFGSGVLLADLAQWRANGTEAALLALGEPGRLKRKFNDQSILNVHFAGRVRFLPRRWNQLRFHWNGTGVFLPLRPGIVHVGGSPKPWQFPVDDAVGVNQLYHQIVAGADVPRSWLAPADSQNPQRTARAVFQTAKLGMRASPIGWLHGLPFAWRTWRERPPTGQAEVERRLTNGVAPAASSEDLSRRRIT